VSKGNRAVAATKRQASEAAATDEVVEKLIDGTYDRMLEGFAAQMEEAAATLRRALAAMKAENTLHS